MAATPSTPNRPPLGKLIDFVEGYDPVRGLDLEVTIKQDGRVVVFHSLPFTKDVSWFEFDLSTNKLDFIMDGGDIRNIGIALKQDIARHMQNSHQILMVLMDAETGQPKEGFYIPLVIHRT